MANVDKQSEKYYPGAATARVRYEIALRVNAPSISVRSVADPTARV